MRHNPKTVHSDHVNLFLFLVLLVCLFTGAAVHGEHRTEATC